MSSANRINDGTRAGNRRAYITTENFRTRFLSYRTALENFITVGYLSPVTADASKCPKGRILRENGRKLYPDANPGVDFYLVGVYDEATFLSGYIDPNSHVFSSFNTDKPYFMNDNVDSFYVSENNNQTEGHDLGDPVYTRGNIETVQGDIIADPNSGDNYITLQNDISGGNAAFFGFDSDLQPYMEVQSGNYTTYGYMEALQNRAELYLSGPQEAQVELNTNTGFVGAYASDGSVYNSGLLHPYNSSGQQTLGSGGVSPSITNDLLTSGGVLVMLTRVTPLSSDSGIIGHLYYTISSNVLTIRSTDSRDRSVVNYLIISNNGNT